MIRWDCLSAAWVQCVAKVVVMTNLLSSGGACHAQLSPARALYEAVRQAEKSDDGLAVLFRMRAIRIGDKASPNNVSENSRLDFHVKTRASEPGKNANELLLRIEDVNSENQGVVTKSRSHQLMAKVEERTFTGRGSESAVIEPKDITSALETENGRANLQVQWKRLRLNPMALPFLTMDAFYFEKADFAAINEVHNLCRLSYEDDKEMCAVWENLKEGVAIKRRLSRKLGNRPVEVVFYKRAPGQEALEKGDKFGELIYRTRTDWQKLEPTTLSSYRKEAVTWVPARIELEQFPHSYKPYESQTMIEILAVWRRVPDDFLSRKTFEAEIPIDNEWVPPNEPISILFHDMLVELEKTAAEAEQQLQRNRR